MDDELKQRILGVIYGNACGDAIGLLTEFMNEREAKIVCLIFIFSIFSIHFNLLKHLINWTEGEVRNNKLTKFLEIQENLFDILLV